MKNKIILASVFVSLLVPFAVGAATFFHEKDGNVLVKSASDIRDNVYTAGKSISIQQVIFGDVLAAGATILISENVSDDIWAAGASVSLLGNTGGDARLAGSHILVNAPVAKDLLAAGGTVTVSQKTTVGGDIVIAGGIINFDGIAQKSARLMGGEIVVNGTINGDAKIYADEKLSFGPGAKILGNLTYRAKKEIAVPEGVVSGSITFEERKRGGNQAKNVGWLPAFFAGFAVVKFLILLIAGLIFVHFAPVFSRTTTEIATGGLGKNLLYGLVVAVVIPIVAILLFVTVFGALIGGVLIAVYILLLVLAKAAAAIVFGAWLAKIVKRDLILEISWRSALLGAFVLSVLMFLPVLGWVVSCAALLITLGAVSTYIYQKLWLTAR